MDTAEFKGNTESFEMSRYIDLSIYHEVERSHPYYIEMIEEMQTQAKLYHKNSGGIVKALELGAGTGLFTQDLARHDFIDVDALELDSDCLKILKNHVGERANCILGNAITYCKEGQYDLLLSTFAHDHINFNLAKDFAKNIRKNLKKGGQYIMGGEILPYFETEAQRCESLYTYHGFIVDKAIRDGHYTLAQIEINALKSGLEMIGDFKRHEKMFEDEMLSADFKMTVKKKMGPVHLDNVGGVFVYVFEAI